MSIDLSDERLATVLASVGEHLDLDGPGRDVSAEASAAPRIRLRPALLAAAAAIVAIALAAAVFAPVRSAVADWLGIGSTSLERVPDVDDEGLAPIDDGLVRISIEEAERRLGRPLGHISTTALGPPATISEMPEGGVLVGWPEGATTLWIHAVDPDAGTLLTKILSSDTGVTEVSGLGDVAVAIEGPHVLQTPHRRIAAGTVLIWADGPTELRLESDLPLTTLTTLAPHLTPN